MQLGFRQLTVDINGIYEYSMLSVELNVNKSLSTVKL